jgi:hypothetical protein
MTSFPAERGRSFDDEPGQPRKPQHMVLDDMRTERSAPSPTMAREV